MKQAIILIAIFPYLLLSNEAIKPKLDYLDLDNNGTNDAAIRQKDKTPFILYEGTWIEVYKHIKTKFGTYRSSKNGTYYFINGKWQKFWKIEEGAKFLDLDRNGTYDAKYDKHNPYILYKGKWIEVYQQKTATFEKFGRANKDGKYFFIKGKWIKKEENEQQNN